MTRSFYHDLASVFLACVIAASTTAAFAKSPAKAVAKSRVSPPPSADLSYVIKAKQKGLPLDGNAIVHWSADANRYSVTTETSAMLLGKILEAKSEGGIDSAGLAPLSSTEKRFRKKATTTTFNRDAKTITFSASDASYPLKSGAQDRNSAVWQLATLARSAPQKFKPGASIPMFVAGQKDADPWTFKVNKPEKISTALGSLNTVQISKVTKDGNKEQKIDIWFAPTMEWYPVRLRFTEPEGDFIEQTIEKITPKS